MTMVKTIQFTYLMGAEYDHGEDYTVHVPHGS